MGIPLYYGKVTADFNCVERKKAPHGQPGMAVDHIMFDMNNLIWMVQNEDISVWLARLGKTVRLHLSFFTPKKSIYFALDGSAPKAKTLLQRDRRMGMTPDDISSLQISPGTDFMHIVKNYLCFLADDILGRNHPNVQVIVSGTDSPGEGEFKMFQMMKTLPSSETCMVIGSDADLILFALRAHREGLYMVNPQRNRNLPREASIVNIDKLRSELHKTLPEHSEAEVVDDFVALSLFSGNDYLPKVLGFDISRAWPKYQKARRGEMGFKKTPGIASCIQKGDHSAIGLLLLNMVTNQTADKLLLQQLLSSYLPKTRISIRQNNNSCDLFLVNGQDEQIYFSLKGKMSGNHFSANFMRSQAFLELIQKNAKPEHLVEIYGVLWAAGHLQIPPPQFPLAIDSVIDNTSQKVQAYTAGLLWVFRYLGGECTNYDFHYQFPGAPTATQMSKIQGFSSPSVSSAKPLTSIESLFSCIPAWGKSLLPATHQRLLEPGSEIYDLYNPSLPKDKQQWKSKQLQQIFERVCGAIKSVPFSPIDAHKFTNQPDLLFSKLTSSHLERWLVSSAPLDPELQQKLKYLPPIHPMRIEHKPPRPGTMCFESVGIGKFDLKTNKFVQKRSFSTMKRNLQKPSPRRIVIKF